MKTRFSALSAQSSFLSYSWYMNTRAKTHEASSQRVSIYGSLTNKPLNRKTVRSAMGYNKIFWRTWLPSRGLLYLAVFGFVLASSLYASDVLFTFYLLAFHATTAVITPLLPFFLFACVFILKLALGVKSSDAGIVTSLQRNLANTRYSLRSKAYSSIFALSAISGLMVFCLRAFNRDKLTHAVAPITPLNPSIAILKYQTQCLFKTGIFQRTVPSYAFKLNILGFTPEISYRSRIVSHVSDTSAYIGTCDLIVQIPLGITWNQRANPSNTVTGLMWPSVAAQLHERTRAVRVLISSWHIFQDSWLNLNQGQNENFLKKPSLYSNSTKTVAERLFRSKDFSADGGLGKKGFNGTRYTVKLDATSLSTQVKALPLTLRHKHSTTNNFFLYTSPATSWSLKTKPWKRV